MGQYRRKQKGEDLQDAAFFDHNNAVSVLHHLTKLSIISSHHNSMQSCVEACVHHSMYMQAGMKAREQALYAALDDMESWLATGKVRTGLICKIVVQDAVITN